MSEPDLVDRLHDLDKRVTQLERVQLSLSQDIKNAADHSLGVDADLVVVKKYLCERRKEREKWSQDKRFVVRHLVAWGTPALIGWTLLVFSSGFRAWVRGWLGA